jgi:IclR family acetate operon transcriptional repressor
MSRPTESLKSLRRAAQVLAQFSGGTPSREPGEIVRAVDFPRSSTYRLLQTMVELGLLDRDATTGRLRPGLSFVALGQLAQQEFELGEVARPFMEELAFETQETVLLAVLRGGLAYYAEKVESIQRIRLSFDLGARLPLHAGASSKILLAQLPESEVQRIIRTHGLPRYTARTITDPTALMRELGRIRRDGYAVSVEEFDPGAWALSAPIHGSRDGTIAGLTLSGPVQRLTPQRRADWIAAVCRTAARISTKLGHPTIEAGSEGAGRTPARTQAPHRAPRGTR